MPLNPHPLIDDGLTWANPAWYGNHNSPYYNASHRAYRERVRAFVDAEVTPFCDTWDKAKAIPRELFVKAFQAGLLPGVVGPPWPEAYAGPGPEVRGGSARRLLLWEAQPVLFHRQHWLRKQQQRVGKRVERSPDARAVRVADSALFPAPPPRLSRASTPSTSSF